MATCKECVHVDVCCSYLSTAYNKLKLATPDFKLLKNIECDECQHFKDRSRFVELSCKVGERLYVPIPKSKYIAECFVQANKGGGRVKSVLISIHPEWCDKIANGEKTIEIRKSKPKLEPPFKCYIYETKAINRKKIIVDLDGELPTTYARGRGKVIGEFICDRIEYLDLDSAGVGFWENGEFIYLKDIGWNTCLTRKEFIEYSNGKKPYGWHISELKIYDKPKELTTRPPQSWCYVEDVSE